MAFLKLWAGNPIYQKEENNYIEYIKKRKMIYNKLNKSVLITEYSLLLPQSNSEEIHRLHINACITSLKVKFNKEEEEYIEWETLISLKENFEYSIEYIVHSKNKEETVTSVLNKMLII